MDQSTIENSSTDQSSSYNSEGAHDSDVEKESSNNSTIYIIIAVICVVVIAIALLIVFIILRRRHKQDQASASIDSETEGLSEILSTAEPIADTATVELFTSNINEESDPFANDFEEIYMD